MNDGDDSLLTLGDLKLLLTGHIADNYPNDELFQDILEGFVREVCDVIELHPRGDDDG